MNAKSRVTTFLVVGSIGLAFLFFVFYYRFSFNYELGMNEQYKLIFVLPVVAAVLGLAMPGGGSNRLYAIVPGMLIALGLLLLSGGKYSFSNEHGWAIAACGLLAMGMFWSAGQEIIVAIFVMVFIVQLSLGCMQLYDAVLTGQSASRLLQGSLQNSGVFGCYLVIQLPLAIWLVRRYVDGKLGKTVALIISSVAIGLMCVTGSRTACIALAATMAAGLCGYYRENLARVLKTWPSLATWGLILAGTAAVAGGAYALFGIKRMSATGRLLKLQVAGAHWADHWWWGTGPGRFSWYYPCWQAAYFRENPEPPAAFVMSAGESYILFNEFLQIFEETGLVGLFIFVAMMIAVFTAKSVKHNALLNAVKLTVVAVLASGLTSYPFHVNAITLIFMICCVLSVALRENRLLPRLHLVVPVKFLRLYVAVAVMVLVAAFCRGARELSAVCRWGQVAGVELPDTETGSEYAALYPVLRNNGKFLTDYGQWLSRDSARCKDAVIVLERAKAYFTSRKTMEATAAAYAQLGQFDTALRHRIWICQFLPNRFMPRYELLKTYEAMRDTLNARKVAQDILRMPVKVQSAEVYDVLEAARRTLGQQK
ncbi:O-antigen ligase family protein [Chitinophaga sp. NPDC101104]|uniref:O-antigen ligase family protein n=1 Tax=Chitinophaga sp. NPDC101104 TaxID=3390561 RepID=UPI003D08C16F